jgi:ElaB/YqjD/DUF883 family membrane-anchored ribosome-binding protein
LKNNYSLKVFIMPRNNDESVARQAADVVDNVADGIRSAAHTVGGTVRSAAHSARDAAGRAASAMEEKYEEAGQYARDTIRNGRDRVRSWEKGIEDHVRDNPKTSLLAAVAIGAILGAWWKRR